jgi:MFS transporter, PHS family, inorganic phosphate transporter
MMGPSSPCKALQLGAALVMLFVTPGFKSSLEGAPRPSQCTDGCPEAVRRQDVAHPHRLRRRARHYRLTIPETSRYTFDVARDVEKAVDDVKAYMEGKPGGDPDELAPAQTRLAMRQNMKVPQASVRGFIRHYGKLENGKLLFGTGFRGLLVMWPIMGCRSTMPPSWVSLGTRPRMPRACMTSCIEPPWAT